MFVRLAFLAALLLAPLLRGAEPVVRALGELDERTDDGRLVTTEGTVVDVVPDEVDARFSVILLKDGATILPVFTDNPPQREELTDARLRVTGTYTRLMSGVRYFLGPYLHNSGGRQVVAPPPADRFAVPEINPTDFVTPRELAAMGRRMLHARVLTVWGDRHVLLDYCNGWTVTATLVRGQPLPPVGATIAVSGYPTTNLYWLDFAKAFWKTAEPSDPPAAPDAIATASVQEILFASPENPRIESSFLGKLVRLTGVVRHLPVDGGRRLTIDCDGHLVHVDLGPVPSFGDVTAGCTVEATGYCLLETERSMAYEVFPQICGFAVVLRTAADLRVVARPPWWTPGRLLAVLGNLLVALVILAVWNGLLRRRVVRRGRQLLRAEVGKVRSELRTDERTNLAVELHDSISQNLSAASMHIDAARRQLDVDRAKTARNLDVASRTLGSCREELRNCIWDLRNQALDEKDLNTALRRTLERLTEDAELAIRVSIPRAHLTDNTAHALICIIRELTVNAVRHGGARHIRVAGAAEEGRILVSVTDDGCGFDPETRPGVAEGHYGLQGIGERIRRFNGTMTVESRPGSGTRVAVALSTKETK